MKRNFLGDNLRAIRERRPLVHNITNYVAMDFSANALLALGASPVMAHAAEEVGEMVAISSALVLNIGTLSAEWNRSFEAALSEAKKRRIPVCLDPVGAGATAFRTETALRLIAAGPPAIVRGNASEIAALAASRGETRGVDSVVRPEEVAPAGRSLCETARCAVVMSGPEDLIFAPGQAARVMNGCPEMSRITGMGCVASAICGACLSITDAPFEAALTAMVIMGVCGEMARETAGARPGSFRTAFIDALALVSPEVLTRQGRIDET